MPNKNIYYSDKYFDGSYEYRHVMLPKDLAKLVPKTHLMSETEWRALGVQQSQVGNKRKTQTNLRLNVMVVHVNRGGSTTWPTSPSPTSCCSAVRCPRSSSSRTGETPRQDSRDWRHKRGTR